MAHRDDMGQVSLANLWTHLEVLPGFPERSVAEDVWKELQELAADVHKLVLENKAMGSWRDKVRAWAEGLAQVHHRWLDWHANREGGPTTGEEEGEEEKPPAPTVEIPEGNMTEEEKYARLAAVHDSMLSGVEKISPWGLVDVYSNTSIAGICYDALVLRTGGSYAGNRTAYQAILEDVRHSERGNKTPGDATQERPWLDDAAEYLPLSEARKLIDDRLTLSAMSKLCKPDGEMRYMRKRGVGCKVHLADFRKYMKGRQSDPAYAAALAAYFSAAGKGNMRFFWHCSKCGADHPETSTAVRTCPKCNVDCELIHKPAPKPRR